MPCKISHIHVVIVKPKWNLNLFCLKGVTGIDPLKFAKKTYLVNLKSNFYRLDIGKVETTPVDLINLSNVVKSNVVKTVMYDELVKGVNAIDSNKQNHKKSLKMLMKKRPHATKFIETHEFNRLTEININARMAEALKYLATKKQIDNALDLGDKNIEQIENFKYWIYFTLSLFLFYYLIFQPVLKSFKVSTGTIATIFRWKFLETSEKSTATLAAPGIGVAPRLNDVNSAKKICTIWGSCLKQDKKIKYLLLMEMQ